MRSYGILSALAGLAAATVTIEDPSDTIGTTEWAADNALLADYTVLPTDYHTLPYLATKTVSGTDGTFMHEVYTVDANDSSVLIITEGAEVTLQYDRFVKTGYSSNLIEASFYGINAAVWVGNGSTAHIDSVNVTVHNGGANVYTYGTDSVTYISNSDLYSSGPVAHGLYASGNGTVYGSNIRHYSGGYRSSSFSGDSPAGYIHVTDSVAHTDGVGSAICYALGLCNVTNTIGHTSHAPAMFMDGIQEAIWTGCDLTAGLLAGMIMFSSQTITTGATLLLENTRLTVLGSTMPALWFGNTIATATLIHSTLNVSASGLLVVANYSQVTQDFDYFASYVDNNNLAPAQVTVLVQESALAGDIVAYNGSSISFSLAADSAWTGKGYSGYGTAYLGVTLDASSTWTLTGDTTVQNFTNADLTMSNIVGNGHHVWYDASAPANAYLKGKHYKLAGGGQVQPAGGVADRGAEGYWGGYGMYHTHTPTTTVAVPVATWVY